jgi:hypothetical protein
MIQGWGHITRGPVELEWFESAKDLGRVAELTVGPLYFRVVNEPEHWMPPHRTHLSVSFSRNRWWRVEFVIGGPRYAKEHRREPHDA